VTVCDSISEIDPVSLLKRLSVAARSPDDTISDSMALKMTIKRRLAMALSSYNHIIKCHTKVRRFAVKDAVDWFLE